MKYIKKLLLKIFFWWHLKQFYCNMKSVTGLTTIAEADEYAKQLECKIRKNNNLSDDEAITFENSSNNREDFAIYTTICYFLKDWETFEQIKVKLRL